MTSAVPTSHTVFSWVGHADRVPAGHTAFSWSSGRVPHAHAMGGPRAAAVGAGAGTGAGGGAASGGSLAARVARVEAAARRVRCVEVSDSGEWSDACALAPTGAGRAAAAAKTHGLLAAVFARVPSDYYSHPLLHRASLLRCSVPQLCKSMILENQGASSTVKPGAPLFAARHVVVVLQYTHELDMGALATAVRQLSPKPLPASKVSFTLALPEDSDRLSGYPHNAVTPFGMSVATPVVVSKSAAAQAVVWLGGGEVDVKLRLSTAQLVAALGATVLPCSVERPETD